MRGTIAACEARQAPFQPVALGAEAHRLGASGDLGGSEIGARRGDRALRRRHLRPETPPAQKRQLHAEPDGQLGVLALRPEEAATDSEVRLETQADRVQTPQGGLEPELRGAHRRRFRAERERTFPHREDRLGELADEQRQHLGTDSRERGELRPRRLKAREDLVEILVMLVLGELGLEDRERALLRIAETGAGSGVEELEELVRFGQGALLAIRAVELREGPAQLAHQLLLRDLDLVERGLGLGGGELLEGAALARPAHRLDDLDLDGERPVSGIGDGREGVPHPERELRVAAQACDLGEDQHLLRPRARRREHRRTASRGALERRDLDRVRPAGRRQGSARASAGESDSPRRSLDAGDRARSSAALKLRKTKRLILHIDIGRTSQSCSGNGEKKLPPDALLPEKATQIRQTEWRVKRPSGWNSPAREKATGNAARCDDRAAGQRRGEGGGRRFEARQGG